ncbi:MAG TPA: NAD(+) diphosphatase [Alphaproteobacteria bacterium]|jgi:NAD+ diphosphatase|nr:NAD(+) diphosphatase [Alphaproteobacteria bacterium]
MSGFRPFNYFQFPPNRLSDPAFDRASHRRLDEAWLEATLRAAGTQVVPVWRGRSLVDPSDPLKRGVTVPVDAVDWSVVSDTVFLGTAGDRPHFAVDISSLEAAPGHFGPHGAFEDMRMIGSLLRNEDAALLAYAKGMLWWHERHRFCGVCGSPTRSVDGGHRRLCTNEACKAEQFPRSDPAVIMLVEHDNKCLLARGARFPANFISVLAGFVEPGESLEDTVAREVFEECGVRVHDITYASSQPWPFPSSLMLGFRAKADDPTFNLDPLEILEAGWYTRDFIRSIATDGPMSLEPGGPVRIPPKFSISRRLIDDWVAEGD